MNFYKQTKEAVDYILSHSSLTQAEISVRAGYREQTLTQLLSAGEVSKRAYDNILREFKGILNKSTTMNTQPNNPKPQEPFSMETIEQMTKTSADLSETNRNLSAATKETASANRILAENQRELIEIIKGMHAPIANAAKETPIEYPSEATRQVMAARGVLQGLWKSADEGRDKLNKLCDEGVLTKRE